MNTKRVVLIILVVAVIVAGAYLMYGNTRVEAPASETTPVMTAEAPQEVAAVIGLWQSTEDPAFTREFLADGTVNDGYVGETSANDTGTWNYVADPVAEVPDLPKDITQPIIKITFGDIILYSIVSEASETRLTLINLTALGTLDFSRVVQ